jgi:multisubunit Na+/H+ antiporter MnhF subunit
MIYVVVAVIWLSVTSLAVTLGRVIRSPAIAYPVAAIASFALLALILAVGTAMTSFGLLTEVQSVQDILGQE